MNRRRNGVFRVCVVHESSRSGGGVEGQAQLQLRESGVRAFKGQAGINQINIGGKATREHTIDGSYSKILLTI